MRERPLDRLVILQHANGAWKLDRHLAKVLGPSAERDEWELLAKKAERWLDRCEARSLDGRSWRVAAEDVLGAQPNAAAIRE